MEEDTRTAADLKMSEIAHDVFDEGVRFIILRGPCSLCAYVGVPIDHPLAGFGYDDLAGISAHGGLTFAQMGGGTRKEKDGTETKLPWPEGYYWYGWDYAHLGDKCTYRSELRDDSDEKDWTVGEVIKDSWETLYDFKRLMKLAEKIKATPSKIK